MSCERRWAEAKCGFFKENRVCFRSLIELAGNPLWADGIAAVEKEDGKEL
jgi:hypothetical protein